MEGGFSLTILSSLVYCLSFRVPVNQFRAAEDLSFLNFFLAFEFFNKAWFTVFHSETTVNLFRAEGDLSFRVLFFVFFEITNIYLSKALGNTLIFQQSK